MLGQETLTLFEVGQSLNLADVALSSSESRGDLGVCLAFAAHVEDAPLTVRLAGQRWSPQNHDGGYMGWISARTALEQSINTATARLALEVGLPPIVATARRLGVSAPLDEVPSLALGAFEVSPLELATVYATLATLAPIPFVSSVTSRGGFRTAFDVAGRRGLLEWDSESSEGVRPRLEPRPDDVREEAGLLPAHLERQVDPPGKPGKTVAITIESGVGTDGTRRTTMRLP